MKKCDKCNNLYEESEFYNSRKICKYCHREYVYSKRFYERSISRPSLLGKKETIKTNPESMTVNYELYNYLLKL